jgi:hypothetical protein
MVKKVERWSVKSGAGILFLIFSLFYLLPDGGGMLRLGERIKIKRKEKED